MIEFYRDIHMVFEQGPCEIHLSQLSEQGIKRFFYLETLFLCSNQPLGSHNLVKNIEF